ncbi:MAG: FAD-dependent oxidoreductase [Rhodospirillales bacterium]
MPEYLEVDICVIGGGSGGLSVAAGAAQMGASTVLVEKGKMGGDCLNYGCVPSKALLAAGHAARAVGRARLFGVDASRPAIVSKDVYGHIQKTITAIAPNDSVERFEGLGVKVIQAPARFTGSTGVAVEDFSNYGIGARVIRVPARFTGPTEIEAGDERVRARRFVIATGSSPFVPPIEGLDATPYHTNETIFDLGEIPEHLIVIGGGPIGIEMAQAHRHLGARVTVLEMFKIMPRDDPELVAVLRARLDEEKIDIREGIKISRVEGSGSALSVVIEEDGAERRIEGSHILVATGRTPNVGGLNLGKAGIEYTPKGILVDARLRTTNKNVFAIGDVAGGYQFTHVAAYHASIVIRNALFRLPAKVDYRAVPWAAYTMPELAYVGLSESQAREKAGEIRILRWPFEDNDRARAELETEGLVKVVVTPRGRILGAGVVGPRAGELIQTWGLAIGAKLKIGAVASMIAPYPTFGEINKRVAGSYFTPKLFSEGTKRIVRFLSLFG